MARDSWGGEGSYTPPPLSPGASALGAAPPSAAEPEEARPMSDVFCAILRALTASRAPPGSPPPRPPHCVARERGGEEG